MKPRIGTSTLVAFLGLFAILPLNVFSDPIMHFDGDIIVEQLDVDPNSNSEGLRIRGAAESSEIADFYVSSVGSLLVDLTQGSDSSQFLDIRTEDDQYGLILRESSASGTQYANFYLKDASDDYLSIGVNSPTDDDALNITASNRVGIGTSAPGNKLDVFLDWVSPTIPYIASFGRDDNSHNLGGIKVRSGSDHDDSEPSGMSIDIYASDNYYLGYIGWDGPNIDIFETSDERLKSDIRNADISGLNVLNEIEIKKYRRAGMVKEAIGFSAQQVQSVYPELVANGQTPQGIRTRDWLTTEGLEWALSNGVVTDHTDPSFDFGRFSESHLTSAYRDVDPSKTYLAVARLKFIPLLVKAVQELSVKADSVLGSNNDALDASAVNVGGDQNLASGKQSATVGGTLNTVTGNGSVILGGQLNSAEGENSVVVGMSNSTAADQTFVGGKNTHLDASASNTFAWGAATSTNTLSQENTFYVFPDGDGSMAIGVAETDPDDRLTVVGGNVRILGGTIITRAPSIPVPDYVFEEDYRIMPVEDLKKYITEHKKLPGIPSAEEFHETGVDITQLQMQLLRNVEELTLRNIEQQRQIADQQRQINELKELVDSPN